MSSILDHFPRGFTPSSQQQKLIKQIDDAFSSGVKFVVCSAPTGSGKSFLSKTLGNSTNPPSEEFAEIVNSYKAYKKNSNGNQSYESELAGEPAFGTSILTITKTLQDQYKELFPDIEVLKGKSNYQCAYDTDYPVDCAPCVYTPKIRDTCWKQDICPYYKARNNAIVSRVSVLNYNMFFALPDLLKYRKLLVCDEAAEIEEQFVKEFSCTISFDFLKAVDIKLQPFPTSEEYNKVRMWINTLTLDLSNTIEDIKDKLVKYRSSNKKYKTQIKGLTNKLSSLINLHDKLTTVLDTWYDSEYVAERNAKSITLMPLKVDKLANRLFKFADKVLLMSATIIDPANYCKSLGITDYKYVEADSTFDPTKAPIYITTKTKLNYNNLQSNLPVIVRSIRDICNRHKNEKGIIHTQTHTITKYLQSNLHEPRIIYREHGVRNEELLDNHYNTDEPTILASPSMSHGVDLKDDLARFQIIIKAPYLPITDKRVERMMKNDFNWYMNKMLCSVIQSCGRGVRSKNDHCVTYILDGAIAESVIKYKSRMPKYFLDRFV